MSGVVDAGFELAGNEGIRRTVPREDAAKDGSQRHPFARGKIELQGQNEAATTASLSHQAGTHIRESSYHTK